MDKIEAEGKAALEAAPTSCPVSNAAAWKMNKMDPILLWYGIATTKSKLNEIKKPEKLSIMKAIQDGTRQPPVHDKWTVEGEAELVELKKMEMDIKDTALGRMMKIEKRKMDAVIDKMDKEERDTLRRKIDELDQAEAV